MMVAYPVKVMVPGLTEAIDTANIIAHKALLCQSVFFGKKNGKMKKTLALILALCLTLAACSAFAAAEEAVVLIPAPQTDLENDAAFQGDWKVAQLLLGDQLIELEAALSLMGGSFPLSFQIADGKLIAQKPDGTGTEEIAYVFENSQLVAQDEEGVYTLQLLEDGTLMISMPAAEGMEISVICVRQEAAE